MLDCLLEDWVVSAAKHQCIYIGHLQRSQVLCGDQARGSVIAPALLRQGYKEWTGLREDLYIWIYMLYRFLISAAFYRGLCSYYTHSPFSGLPDGVAGSRLYHSEDRNREIFAQHIESHRRYGVAGYYQ